MQNQRNTLFNLFDRVNYLAISAIGLAIVLAACVLLWQPSPLNATPLQTMDHPAVEWLKFRVPPQEQAFFLQKDDEIWTPVLASSPGFVGKEAWQHPYHADEVILVIRWTSRDDWKAIPEDLLDQTTQRFNEAVGADYPLLEATEFRPIAESMS